MKKFTSPTSKLGKAMVVVQALFNLDHMPKEDNVHVKRYARYSKPALDDLVEKALAVLNKKEIGAMSEARSRERAEQAMRDAAFVRKATTKISKKDGEYRVRLFIKGEYQKDCDYFTDDPEDARRTAIHMAANAVPSSVAPVKPEPTEEEVRAEVKRMEWKADLKRLADGINGKVEKEVWEELWEMAWSSGDLGLNEEGQRIINAVFTIHRSSRCATPEMVKLALDLLVRSM